MPSALTENMLFHQPWLLHMMHTGCVDQAFTLKCDRERVIQRNKLAFFLFLLSFLGYGGQVFSSLLLYLAVAGMPSLPFVCFY